MIKKTEKTESKNDKAALPIVEINKIDEDVLGVKLEQVFEPIDSPTSIASVILTHVADDNVRVCEASERSHLPHLFLSTDVHQALSKAASERNETAFRNLGEKVISGLLLCPGRSPCSEDFSPKRRFIGIAPADTLQLKRLMEMELEAQAAALPATTSPENLARWVNVRSREGFRKAGMGFVWPSRVALRSSDPNFSISKKSELFQLEEGSIMATPHAGSVTAALTDIHDGDLMQALWADIYSKSNMSPELQASSIAAALTAVIAQPSAYGETVLVPYPYTVMDFQPEYFMTGSDISKVMEEVAATSGLKIDNELLVNRAEGN